MQVGCNYTNWNIARHESIILSVSENAMATYDIASRNFYKTFAHPNPTTLHPNVRGGFVLLPQPSIFVLLIYLSRRARQLFP